MQINVIPLRIVESIKQNSECQKCLKSKSKQWRSRVNSDARSHLAEASKVNTKNKNNRHGPFRFT